MFETVSDTKLSEDLEKTANSLVYNVIRRILETTKYRSASGICPLSSPSILCSLSDDSVNSRSIPFIPNSPEDKNDRCSKRICMDDVMSKLLDTAPSTSNLITSANENKVQSDTISTDEYITNCLSGEIDAKNQSENDFEKTDNMASLNKADDKQDVTYRNRIFHLRRSFSESALMLVKDGDILMKEATDEQIQENLRSLRFDLDKLFNESEVIITKYVEHFWNFIKKTEEKSIANNSQSPIPMSERLACIEDFTNTLRKEFKEYNNMIKHIVVSTYKIAKEGSAVEIKSLQRKINKKDVVLNHFREENMRITHVMMEKEQDWALLKSKLYAEILNLTKETTKPWKELFSAGPKFGLVSLPWKRLKSLFEIYHSQEKMMSLVLDRDRKINELKFLIYQQQMMNCSLQEKLLQLNSAAQEPANVNSGDTNEALKSELSRVSDVLHICTGSTVPYVSTDPDEAIMEIFNLKGEEDLTSPDSYADYFHNVDNCTDACSAPAVHDLMARFQDTTCE